MSLNPKALGDGPCTRKRRSRSTASSTVGTWPAGIHHITWYAVFGSSNHS
jgi:hypothetical protein